VSTPATPTAIGPQAYQSWRTTSLGAVTEAIEQRLILELMGDLNDARVLDVGCGDGVLTCAAASRGAHVTGVDPDPAMLDAGRSRAGRAGVKAEFLDGRIERLPFADASFDVVAAVTVLCFVDEASLAVREMARVLRPGGRLVLGELGRWSGWAAIRRLRGWLGSASWQAARFRTAGELRTLAEEAGFRVATIRGAVFYPPAGFCMRVLAPVDAWLGRLTTAGAAFIALAAIKIPDPAERAS
jgi:ubiquinone/menaquinone biosynthesis C-methylase UbiE